MIIVLWRAGLRVQEALALAEHDLDLDPRRGSLLVRSGRVADRDSGARTRPKATAWRPACRALHNSEEMSAKHPAGPKRVFWYGFDPAASRVL
jgi:integrase